MTGVIRRIISIAVIVGCITVTAFSQELPAWVKKLKISGDLGLRTEVINDEKTADHFDRVRNRARFRLSLDTNPVDKITVSFGVETSGTNPTSAWADFTDFQNQPLYLAHAYMQYKPNEHLTISGGKLKNNVPYWKPSQLIWKNDVNPFGVSTNITAKLTDKVTFFTNGGFYALTEYRDNQRQVDVPMNAIVIVQPGIEAKQGKLSVKGALSVQQFSLVNHSTANWIKSNTSYTLINPAWDVRFNNLVSSYGVSFNGEYSKNVNESADQDTVAYILSFGFGSASLNNFKTWQVAAAHRRLERYAIPIGFGDTSAYNADPGRGWEYSAGFGLLRDLSVTAKLLNMTDIQSNLPQLVSQFDVIYKF